MFSLCILSVCVIGAIINITSPINYTILYPGDFTNISINEIRNIDWINNLTIEINNENYSAANFTEWEYNYTIPNIAPTLLRVTAYGFNISYNVSVKDNIDLRISKLNPNTPSIDYISFNETYSFNNSGVNIVAKISADTLINYSNFTITTPSGAIGNYEFNLSTSSGLVYYYTYYLVF